MDPASLVWYKKWMTEVTGTWKKYIFVKTTFFGFSSKDKSGKWKIIYHPWDKSLNQLNTNLLQKHLQEYLLAILHFPICGPRSFLGVSLKIWICSELNVQRWSFEGEYDSTFNVKNKSVKMVSDITGCKIPAAIWINQQFSCSKDYYLRIGNYFSVPLCIFSLLVSKKLCI